MISVVVPVYNKQNSIKRCIESVLKQSYINWELLLIDDGSTDNSAKIIQPYLKDDRIHYYHKENGGVSSARNMGIRKAKGEWIIFLDSDDYFLPNALNSLLQTAEPNHVLISAGNYLLEKNGKRIEICFGRKRLVKNNFRSWYFMTCFVRTGNTMFHSSIFEKYIFNESLSRYEDAELFFRIMRDYKITYTDDFVLIYSLEDLGLSRKSKDISKDFIFSMNFQGKSFWEKMNLLYMLNQGLRLYPEHKRMLYMRYSSVMWMTYIESLVWFMGRSYRKLRRTLRIK